MTIRRPHGNDMVHRTSGGGERNKEGCNWSANIMFFLYRKDFYKPHNMCQFTPNVLLVLYEVPGSIPGTSSNFECGLGVERGPPSLVSTIGGSYLIEKSRIWLRKSTLIDLTGRNANHIIPSCCHLPVSCRSLVDRCGSPGSCKPQIFYLIYRYMELDIWLALDKLFNELWLMYIALLISHNTLFYQTMIGFAYWRAQNDVSLLWTIVSVTK